MDLEKKIEWISSLHKQNLNGRETEDELFELGIRAGIEECHTDEEVLNILIKFWQWSTLYTRKEHLESWFDKYNKQKR